MTDRETDRQTELLSISRVSVLTRDKNPSNEEQFAFKNQIIQKIEHKQDNIEKTSETWTYNSTIKNLLKSTVRILSLKLFNELKSVSAFGRQTISWCNHTLAKTCFLTPRLWLHTVCKENSRSVNFSVHAWRVRNVMSYSEDRSDAGKLFHVVGPLYCKTPLADRRGTIRTPDAADSPQSQRRPEAQRSGHTKYIPHKHCNLENNSLSNW